METRGPVVFASIYTAGVVLTLVAVAIHDRFAAVDLKSWAAILQAVLSATAIYSAWWLQDRKRRSDRQEARDDTIVAALEYARAIEYTFRGATSAVRAAKLSAANAVTYRLPLVETGAALRKLNMGHMPTTVAAKALMNMQHMATVALARIEYAAMHPAISTGYFDATWEALYKARTTLMSSVGSTDFGNRALDVPPYPGTDAAVN